MGVEGRAKTFSIIETQLSADEQTLWFHCASLGEYEQGLPIFKQIRDDYPQHKIILTFFSPSGYEIRKNTPVADIVVYLPIDTPTNAKRFIQLIKPELTVFVKYEIWPNYLKELKKRHLNAILISALFRKEQSYFKFYGGIMKEALTAFNHIFVQNESSETLLHSINYNQVTIAGDTRYDRVADQLLQNNTLSFIEEFIDGKVCVVIGSSWPEDEALFLDFINSSVAQDAKFIIAPHNIKPYQISQLTQQLKRKVARYSEKEGKNLVSYEVFIVDTIGILSKIYNYADIAYVGGAMGQTGLHNILEPAVFGVPIIIGKNYQKFPEAYEMIAFGGVISIANGKELEKTLEQLITDGEERIRLGQLNRNFITRKRGAVIKIMSYLRK